MNTDAETFWTDLEQWLKAEARTIHLGYSPHSELFEAWILGRGKEFGPQCQGATLRDAIQSCYNELRSMKFVIVLEGDRDSYYWGDGDKLVDRTEAKRFDTMEAAETALNDFAVVGPWPLSPRIEQVTE